MKTPRNLLTFVVALAIFCAARGAWGTVLAGWSFETTQPTTAGPVTPESGTGTGTSIHASAAVYTSPIGNGSDHSWSANNWAVGDCWQFEVNATGATAVQIDFDQTSSTAGPRDFVLQYSTDGTNFTTYSSYSLASPTISWSGFVTNSLTHFSATIPELGNAATAYVRVTDNGTAPVGPTSFTTVQATGTDRVDNVIISSVPEPSAFLLAAMGAGTAGMMYRRRLQKRKGGDFRWEVCYWKSRETERRPASLSFIFSRRETSTWVTPC